MRYFLMFLLLFPLTASAHGLVTTRQQIVGNYKIEFEYNTQGSIFAGDYIIYDTYLLNNADDQPIAYDSAFIRFEKKNGPPISASALSAASNNKGYASTSLAIDTPGTYTAAISFIKDNKQLVAENKFDFDVLPKSSNNTPSKLVLSIVSFVVGAAIGSGAIFWWKSEKK